MKNPYCHKLRGHLLILASTIAALVVSTSLQAADTNVLIIGSTADGGDRFGGKSDPFVPTQIATELRNILSGIPALGTVNVVVEERYKTGSDAFGSSYSYNLASWYHWPYPAGVETATRWPNLRGELGTAWDYVILIGDPYTMEKLPGHYAHGVEMIAQEVAKGSAETILLMPWPAPLNNESSVAHYKEVVYRAGRTGGYKVAPAALAWQADGSNTSTTHPSTRGAFICAASIYSRIWGQSAKNSTYEYDDTLADLVNTTVANNVGQPQYTGSKMNFQNPWLMLGDKRREVWFSEKGSSTENYYSNGIKNALSRARVMVNESLRDNISGSYTSNPGWTGDHVPIAWNHGREGDATKGYVVNPDYWQLAFTFHFQLNSQPYADDEANDFALARIYSHELNQARSLISQGPTARNAAWRTIWGQFHKMYPTVEPVRDTAWHVATPTEDAVGAFMYTLYSGRCPITPGETGQKADARMLGYQTAWRLGTCSARAPGFKVMPSAASAVSVTPGATDTMSVQFLIAPRHDVTVTVTSSDPSAGIVGPTQLIFTPANYNVAQTVTLTGVNGSSASAPFNVVYSTSSDDPAYDALSDSWAYTCNRPLTVTFNPNNGTTPNPTTKSVTYGSTYGALPTTTRSGHTFNGWFTATTGGTQVSDTTIVTATANHTLYAQWTSAATYTVSYNGNGNSGGTAPSNQTKTEGVPLTLATNIGNLTKTGYSFAGWNTADNGSGTSYAAGASYSANAAVTLYAKWSTAPSADAGADQTIAWESVIMTPGLAYGTVAGNIDITTPNPKTEILVNVASKTEDLIAGNTTEIYTGMIYDADGQISFTEYIDDKARIWIDGNLVISNDAYNVRTSTANLNLTAGWHTIEIRISNGSGGSGPVGGQIGIGYDPAGGTAWQTLVDPGDGSFLKVQSGGAGGSTALAGSANDVDGDALTYSWNVVSKPSGSAVSFGNVSAPNSSAYFDTAGTYVLRLTVSDGYAQDTDDVTIVLNPPPSATYTAWAGGNFANAFISTGLTDNPDGDSSNNLMEFALGTDPTLQDSGSLAINGTVNGSPVPVNAGGGTFEYYFVRRKDHGTSGSVNYTVQFSDNLTGFTNSVVTPTFVVNSSADPDYEVVKVPFPSGFRFGRLQIEVVP